MGFLSRLFGFQSGSGSAQITPDQMGHALFDIALERVRDHHAQLEELGAFETNGVSQSKQHQLGMVVFVLAPLDQVLTDFALPQVHAAKSVIRTAFVDKFKIQNPSQMIPIIDKQMSAYAQTVRSHDLKTLGALAVATLGLPENDDVEMLLTTCYTSSLNFWLDELAKFGIDTS